jgi:peptidoglycan/LPS O-acetylase OafA/YrhL
MHNPPIQLLLRCLARPSAGRDQRDDRGDVPGWVMVTVMTIGLAIAIFTFAEEPLKGLLSAAFNQVK